MKLASKFLQFAALAAIALASPAQAATEIMIGKRLMFAIPSLIGVVIVTFLLTRALPGDPAAYFAGPAATKEAVEQIRKKLGFDKPLIEQFIRYTNDLAHELFVCLARSECGAFVM